MNLPWFAWQENPSKAKNCKMEIHHLWFSVRSRTDASASKEGRVPNTFRPLLSKRSLFHQTDLSERKLQLLLHSKIGNSTTTISSDLKFDDRRNSDTLRLLELNFFGARILVRESNMRYQNLP